MFYLNSYISKNANVASQLNEKIIGIFISHSFSNTLDGASTLFEKIAPYIAEHDIGMATNGHF